MNLDYKNLNVTLNQCNVVKCFFLFFKIEKTSAENKLIIIKVFVDVFLPLFNVYNLLVQPNRNKAAYSIRKFVLSPQNVGYLKFFCIFIETSFVYSYFYKMKK